MSSPVESSVTRALPPRPSLEYERKQARKLLNQLRKGEPSALKRAQVQLGDRATKARESFKLADAQLVIAREYGFRSWPRLVEYFRTLKRQQYPDLFRELSQGDYERRAQDYLRMHQRRDPYAARFFGAYVPRFYGSTPDEIFAASISIDDARLVVAREEHCPNWDVLMARPPVVRDYWVEFDSPRSRAGRAWLAHNTAEFKRIVEAHPELAQPRGPDERFDRTLVYSALGREIKSGSAEDRALTDWLVARGADLQDALNHRLLGHMRMPTEEVAYLLERGADPNWLPPNGITVLEHALVRYWNAEAADLIAGRVTPRKAFWIAAGLGDVRALDRYIDGQGRPNEAAMRHRPDFRAMWPHGYVPPLVIPDPQEVVWEAFFVAALNQRFEVLETLLERGFPVDTLGHGTSLLSFAVGNGKVPLVEFLVQHGADPELPQRYYRPREIAEMALQHTRGEGEADRRRILQLVGGRELPPEPSARPSEPAELVPNAKETLALAREEAHRLGQANVELHNVFVAMLRTEGNSWAYVLRQAGVDIDRLRDTIGGQRLIAPRGTASPDVPLSRETAAVLDAAREDAESRGSNTITSFHLLDALLRLDNGDIERILNAAGGTTERVRQANFEILEQY